MPMDDMPGIADEESVEDRLRRFNAEMDRLVQFRLEPAHSLDDLMQKAMETLSRSLRVARASVWFLENGDTELVCACLYEAGSGPAPAGARLQATQYPSYFRAFRDSRVIDAHDAVQDRRTSEFASGYLDVLGISSMLDSQISDRQTLRGVICCEHTGAGRTWLPEEVAFVAGVGEYLGLALELIERERLTEELRDANARLQAAILIAEASQKEAEKVNQLKTEFLANTSHELRTPLNGILGGVTILRADDSPEAVEKWLGIIEKSGQWLLNSVNALLDVAALEDGSLTAEYQAVQLPALIEEAARLGLPLSGEQPDPVFDFSALPSHGVSVVVDVRKIRQVIANYVSNAVKFAPGRPVQLVAAPAETIERGIRISVIDQGPGLPPGQEEAIFERFRQGDGSASRPTGGTGLGLAICREFATLFGGEVWAENGDDGGAVFILEFPARPDASA